MAKAKLTFEFLGYWHMGSGAGEGANLDAIVIKTKAGLPFIPGRTVKGIVRESVFSMEELGISGEESGKKLAAEGTTDKLFGKGSPDNSRFDTTFGELMFTSATLGYYMERWAGEPDNEEKRELLYQQVASTKIDNRGLADDKSLRRIEVTVPLKLTAYAESRSEGSDWISVLKAAAPLIRHIGSHRHRGLGRVLVNVEEVS